jgi:hypothetical protein
MCPKCGRTVDLPLGNYYCRVCGPSVLMVKIGNPNSAEVEVSEGFPEDIKRVVRLFINELERYGFSVKVSTDRTTMTVHVKYKTLADEMKSLLPKSGFYPHIEAWKFTAFADEAVADIYLKYEPPFFEVEGLIPVMLATAEKPPTDFSEAILAREFPRIKFDIIRFWLFYGLYKVVLHIFGSERAQPSNVVMLLEEVRSLVLKARDISLNMLRPETVWAKRHVIKR